MGNLTLSQLGFCILEVVGSNFGTTGNSCMVYQLGVALEIFQPKQQMMLIVEYSDAVQVFNATTAYECKIAGYQLINKNKSLSFTEVDGYISIVEKLFFLIA